MTALAVGVLPEAMRQRRYAVRLRYIHCMDRRLDCGGGAVLTLSGLRRHCPAAGDPQHKGQDQQRSDAGAFLVPAATAPAR